VAVSTRVEQILLALVLDIPDRSYPKGFSTAANELHQTVRNDFYGLTNSFIDFIGDVVVNAGEDKGIFMVQ
jgi:hypothetical protein